MRPLLIAVLAAAWLPPGDAGAQGSAQSGARSGARTVVRAGTQGGAIHGTITVPGTGITDVVVYLVPATPSDAPAPPALTAEMDQRDLAFAPRVVTVTPGSKVTFANSDRVMHSVFNPWRRGEGFDLGIWPPGELRSFTFAKEGAYVILCSVHPEMVGYVVVVASAHRAVTDDLGRFHFENVPPGAYRLRTWHRRLRMHEQNVTVTEAGSVQVSLSLSLGRAMNPRASP